MCSYYTYILIKTFSKCHKLILQAKPLLLLKYAVIVIIMCVAWGSSHCWAGIFFCAQII